MDKKFALFFVLLPLGFSTNIDDEIHNIVSTSRLIADFVSTFASHLQELDETKEAQVELFAQFARFVPKIETLQEAVNKLNLDDTFNKLEEINPQFITQRYEITEIIETIEQDFKNMVHYINSSNPHMTEFNDLAWKISNSENYSPTTFLKNYLKEYPSSESNKCEASDNLEEKHKIFYVLAFYELKALLLKQLVSQFYITNKIEFRKEGIDKKDIETSMKQALLFLENYLAPVPYWKCDPKNYIKGETYEEITRLVQGYVQNDADSSQCPNTCDVDVYISARHGYGSSGIRMQKRCNGKILSCEFVESDMVICPSKDKIRRYDFIKYENGSILGDESQTTCGSKLIEIKREKSPCPYCMCMCDQADPFSDRYVSLGDSVSDISNNRVVTGLRFAKVNRIIHLQVEEAELLANGEINQKTLHWVPVNSYRITDAGIYNKEDYHTLQLSERTINLDDVSVNDGHIITGVRFQVRDGALNFEVRETKFDYETGTLSPTETTWKQNEIPKEERSEINLEDVDMPTKSKRSNRFSKSGQFLVFTHSDLETDVAQTTVPFLDMQPVSVAKPLKSAGIFHRMEDGYGGFIAPKIQILRKNMV